MNIKDDEALAKNIRSTASIQALKQIGEIVEQERKTDAIVARVLHAFLLYGWVVLLLLAGLVAHWMGVI